MCAVSFPALLFRVAWTELESRIMPKVHTHITASETSTMKDHQSKGCVPCGRTYFHPWNIWRTRTPMSKLCIEHSSPFNTIIPIKLTCKPVPLTQKQPPRHWILDLWPTLCPGPIALMLWPRKHNNLVPQMPLDIWHVSNDVSISADAPWKASYLDASQVAIATALPKPTKKIGIWILAWEFTQLGWGLRSHTAPKDSNKDHIAMLSWENNAVADLNNSALSGLNYPTKWMDHGGCRLRFTGGHEKAQYHLLHSGIRWTFFLQIPSNNSVIEHNLFWWQLLWN